jgi:hypothetical protein
MTGWTSLAVMRDPKIETCTIDALCDHCIEIERLYALNTDGCWACAEKDGEIDTLELLLNTALSGKKGG